MRLWDRLSGPEKAALVRQWQKFADLHIKTSEVVSMPGTLGDAIGGCWLVLALAKARASYVRGIVDAWHRLTFPAKPHWQDVRIPADLYDNDADLDHWLWEQHPGNVLDILQEASA